MSGALVPENSVASRSGNQKHSAARPSTQPLPHPSKRHKGFAQLSGRGKVSAEEALIKQRFLELQGFTGFPHLRIRTRQGNGYADAIVEKLLATGLKVGYECDGSSEILDLTDDAAFERFSGCGDLRFGDLEDAARAAADQDPQSSDQEDQSSEVFEVEGILGKRVVKNKVEYLVSWKGYSQEHNSYEPQSNLGDCRQIIDKFERAEAEAVRKAAEADPQSPIKPNTCIDWQAVEEKWMATAPFCQREHRLGGLNYITRAPAQQEAGTQGHKLCCAVWNRLKCTEVAVNGKAYCAHHICMVQSRMLEQVEMYVSRKGPKEELKQMRAEDDHRGAVALSKR